MIRARLTAVVVMALVLVAGCGSDRKGTGDAPAHQLPKTAVDVIPFPDEFPNVAFTCDGHGHRVYVTTHNKDDSPPVVVNDTSCAS